MGIYSKSLEQMLKALSLGLMVSEGLIGSIL